MSAAVERVAKAGLIGLMHSLVLEGRPHGVHVNAIAPFARTQMTRESVDAAALSGLEPEAAWLVDAHSPCNGEVIVAGASRIARAEMHCSDIRDCAPVDLARTNGMVPWPPRGSDR